MFISRRALAVSALICVWAFSSQRVIAHVPLSEMFGYATDMRSKTQGRGQYVMEPDTYAEVPKNIAEKIMSERAKKD